MLKNILVLCLCFLSAVSVQAQEPVLDQAQIRTWVAGWQQTARLNVKRAGAAVVQKNGVIYVIGGINGVDFVRTVEYSRIRNDGSLEPWQFSPPILEKRGFFSAVIVGDYIYIAGGARGQHGSELHSSVERAHINKNGSLGPWTEEDNHLKLPRRCAKLVAINNKIYSLGGYSGTLLDSVEQVTVLANGHLGAWTLASKTMTVPRYVNAVKADKRGVFVIAGHDQGSGFGLATVERGLFVGQSTELSWASSAPLNARRYALAAALHEDYLYALGGLDGANYLSSIEKAKITDQGLEPWSVTTPLSDARANFSTIVYNKRIYILGGTQSSRYYDRVEYASFNDAGDIGYWASAADIQNIDDKTNDSLTTPGSDSAVTRFAGQGEVIETFSAAGYRYVRVRTDDATLWIAGPESTLAVGDRVGFSQGAMMSEFYSKSLNRHFNSIRFVATLEKVESPGL